MRQNRDRTRSVQPSGRALHHRVRWSRRPCRRAAISTSRPCGGYQSDIPTLYHSSRSFRATSTTTLKWPRMKRPD